MKIVESGSDKENYSNMKCSLLDMYFSWDKCIQRDCNRFSSTIYHLHDKEVKLMFYTNWKLLNLFFTLDNFIKKIKTNHPYFVLFYYSLSFTIKKTCNIKFEIVELGLNSNNCVTIRQAPYLSILLVLYSILTRNC